MKPNNHLIGGGSQGAAVAADWKCVHLKRETHDDIWWHESFGCYFHNHPQVTTNDATTNRQCCCKAKPALVLDPHPPCSQLCICMSKNGMAAKQEIIKHRDHHNTLFLFLFLFCDFVARFVQSWFTQSSSSMNAFEISSKDLEPKAFW